MSELKACPICGNENWGGERCLNCGHWNKVERANTVKVRYVTKSGEVLYSEFSDEYGCTFERWFSNNMQHNGGFFPYKGGKINYDALTRIEVVEE